MRDADRLYVYAERFFQRHNKTQWPTVREAARALRWKQARVEETIEGDSEYLMLTSYFVTPEPKLGEKYVETLEMETKTSSRRGG